MKKKGFTLVELLAVLVILAVILVIAIPKVISIIEDAKKGTLESTAKMIASSAEKLKAQNEVFETNIDEITCENVVKLSKADYKTCYIEFIENQAYVTIFGSNKFDKMYVCKGTKNKANVVSRCPNERVNIELILNGGTVTNNISGIHKEGETIELEQPIRDNGIFLKWEIVKGNSIINGDQLTVGSEDTILWAEYSIAPNVTIDLDNGTDNAITTKKYEMNTNIDLGTPTKVGHDFLKWEIVEGNGVLSGNNFTVGDIDTLIRAKYQIKEYSITYELSGGEFEVNQPTSGTYGSTIILNNPKRAGYTFIGWINENTNSELDDNKITINTENIVLKAIWEARTDTPYKVRHYKMNSDGSTYELVESKSYTGTTGTSVSHDVYTYTDYVTPEIQTKEIAGDGNMSIDYYYNRTSYAINYVLDGGYRGTNSPRSAVWGQTVTITNPSKTGYSFDKWTMQGTGAVLNGNKLTMAKSSVTLTASWKINTYTINYDLDGGTLGNSAPTSGTYGSVVTVSEPTKEGYDFDRWYIYGTGSSMSGTSLTIGSSNITLTAYWKAKTYSITYNLDGGYLNYPQTSGKAGDQVYLYTPSKSGFTFAGWEVSGKGAEISGSYLTIGSEDIVLTAKWKAKTYTITYSLDGGTKGTYAPEEAAAGSVVTVSEPTKEGHTFNGWTIYGSGASIDGTQLTMGSANISLYAKWKKNTYTITYELDGGTLSYPTTSASYNDMIYLSSPSKTGYTFDKWEVSGKGSSLSGSYLTVGSENIVLTAKWKPNTYYITYYLNGGTKGAYAPSSGECGETVIVSEPTRNGYTFDGWTIHGTGASIDGTNLTIGSANITLNANWK